MTDVRRIPREFKDRLSSPVGFKVIKKPTPKKLREQAPVAAAKHDAVASR